MVLLIQSRDLKAAASSWKMLSFACQKTGLAVVRLLCYVSLASIVMGDETRNQTRPYEFSFNIVDFQHRYEKKDADGIITGEFGFVTADGVYHETGYATDKNDDFIITRMRNRKINSLKDAQEIFKDRPEAAKKLVEAVIKACGGCTIPITQGKIDTTTQAPPTVSTSTSAAKLGPILKEMMKTLAESRRIGASKGKVLQGKNKIPQDSKDESNDRRGKSLKEGIVRDMVNSAKKLLSKGEAGDGNSRNMLTSDRVLEKMADDLYYRFNYTITTHGHHEDGYRSGKKDGSYRAQSENGVDTRVKYLTNEFGHQPNISFVPRVNGTTEDQRLKGYSFLWYWS